jgi:hypothetical protein
MRGQIRLSHARAHSQSPLTRTIHPRVISLSVNKQRNASKQSKIRPLRPKIGYIRLNCTMLFKHQSQYGSCNPTGPAVDPLSLIHSCRCQAPCSHQRFSVAVWSLRMSAVNMSRTESDMKCTPHPRLAFFSELALIVVASCGK